MDKVEIVIIDTKKLELGIPTEDEYTNLYFRRTDLNGYWVSVGDEDTVIVFYIAGVLFNTEYSKKTIDLFNNILNEKPV